MDATATRSNGSRTEASTSVDAMDVKNIKSLQLADGWHDVAQCQYVQFAVGEPHSPISPSKLFPALRYQSEGRTVRTPLSQILSFSEDSSRR